jgi:L-fucose mutarotase/ribose pyranase (RbsD/FucU family)
MEMGHGDEIVIAEVIFPAASIAQRLIRADGHGVPPVLEAILKLFSAGYLCPPAGGPDAGGARRYRQDPDMGSVP